MSSPVLVEPAPAPVVSSAHLPEIGVSRVVVVVLVPAVPMVVLVVPPAAAAGTPLPFSFPVAVLRFPVVLVSPFPALLDPDLVLQVLFLYLLVVLALSHGPHAAARGQGGGGPHPVAVQVGVHHPGKDRKKAFEIALWIGRRKCNTFHLVEIKLSRYSQNQSHIPLQNVPSF